MYVKKNIISIFYFIRSKTNSIFAVNYVMNLFDQLINFYIKKIDLKIMLIINISTIL